MKTTVVFLMLAHGIAYQDGEVCERCVCKSISSPRCKIVKFPAEGESGAFSVGDTLHINAKLWNSAKDTLIK